MDSFKRIVGVYLVRRCGRGGNPYGRRTAVLHFHRSQSVQPALEQD